MAPPLLTLAGLGLGLARASLVADPPSDPPCGQTVTLHGQVADRPKTRGTTLRLRPVIEPGLPVATPESQRLQAIVARPGLRRLVAGAVRWSSRTRRPAGDPAPGGGRGRGSQPPLGGRPGLFTGDLPGHGSRDRPAARFRARFSRCLPVERSTRSLPAFWPLSGRGSRSSRWAVSSAVGTRRWRP